MPLTAAEQTLANMGKPYLDSYVSGKPVLERGSILARGKESRGIPKTRSVPD
jgi:hypothetical protein